LVVGQVAGVSTPTKSNKDAIYLTCVLPKGAVSWCGGCFEHI